MEKAIENAKKNMHEYILSEWKLRYEEYISLNVSHDKKYVSCTAF